MATIISPANYTTLSDNFADIRTHLDQAAPYLYSSLLTIVQLDDFEPTLDLLQTFYNVYIAQTASLSSNTPYLDICRAINNHVLRRSGQSTLNAYLEANAITVDANWQDMCADAGYTISNDNVL